VVAWLDLPQLEGLAPPAELPVRLVLGPRRAVRAVTLQRTGDAPGRYRVSLRFDLGSPGAVHDPAARYRLPFGGERPRALHQGPGGAQSHTGDLEHAFDFALPVGTPVLAARAGTVVQVQDGFGPGGLAREQLARANHVIVGHADGTLASYVHLRAGVPVRVGQPVEGGERLGLSGESGLASGPHLHFHVWKRGRGGGERSLPVDFVGADGAPLVLETGGLYGPSPERRDP